MAAFGSVLWKEKNEIFPYFSLDIRRSLCTVQLKCVKIRFRMKMCFLHSEGDVSTSVLWSTEKLLFHIHTRGLEIKGIFFINYNNNNNNAVKALLKAEVTQS